MIKLKKHSCKGCSKFKNPKSRLAVDLIKKLYSEDPNPWILGFSGGKDSTALLKLLFIALSELPVATKSVTVIYCDTGVEIPIVNAYVKKLVKELRAEAKALNLPIFFKIAAPKIEDRYFVKVIGRGYPPPTNIFRWCTDRLRVKPVEALMKRIGAEKATVLIGVRENESRERDKIIEKNRIDKYILAQSSNKNITLFCPIIDFSLIDVWSIIMMDSVPESVNGDKLSSIYKDASGECPTIRSPKASPCGKGRFGCWTCTVVRKDKAVTSLVNNGYDSLSELLYFRNWLVSIRDDQRQRWTRRRNGQKGLGPFTVSARKMILRRLIRAEKKSGHHLISVGEVKFIKELWKADKDLYAG